MKRKISVVLVLFLLLEQVNYVHAQEANGNFDTVAIEQQTEDTEQDNASDITDDILNASDEMEGSADKSVSDGNADYDEMQNSRALKYAEISDNMIGGYISSELDYNTPVYDNGISLYANIPSSFQNEIADYPDNRDQTPYGTCWAFSAIGLAEFDLINKGAANSAIDLSELQLIYYNFNSVLDPLGGTEGDQSKFYNSNNYNFLNYGGNYEFATRRLAQWSGVVSESDVPYNQAYNVSNNGLADEYAYSHNKFLLNNAYIINIKENTDDVKLSIMEHGAVGVMYLHNSQALLWNSEKQLWTYYDTDYSGGGHAVMVVGWDDDFSKDNFPGTSKPSNDGAWLIRNSWGTYVNYFWMSYESASLSTSAWVLDFENIDKYDNNYQLDGGLSTYYDSYYTKAANVFKVQNSDGVKSETLKSVQLSFTHKADIAYTIEVYTNLKSKNDPLSGEKQEQATTVGQTAYAGIYTIELDDSVTLEPGTYFSVVVSVDKNGIDYEQGINYADGDDTVWECPAVSHNDSFYSSNGKNYYAWPFGNYCIKALTSNDKGITMDELAEEHRNDIEDGTYLIKSTVDSGYVMDVYNSSQSNEANVQIHCESGVSSQKWTISHDSKGYVTITNAGSNKVLDVFGGGTQNGTNIQQFVSNGSRAQKWVVIKQDDGSYEIVTALDRNKCIDLDGAQTVNGANIQLFVVNGSPAQRWIISKKSTMDELAEEHKDDIEDGTYLIKSTVDSGYVMDVYNSSQSNEANVQIHCESGVSSQKWTISHDSKGYVTITNAGSNKVLDVFGGGTQNGTNIQQFVSNGSRAQKWVVIKQDDGSYEIVTALDRNKCIDLDGAQTVNGANIQLFVVNGSPAQRWIISKKSTMDELAEEHKDDIEDGIYLIKSIVDSGYVMDVYNSSQSNEANVQIHCESGVSSQKWTISHDSKGYVTITNAGSNKVLDVFGGGTQNGTNIQQFVSNGSRAQKWVVIKQDDGSYEIVTALDRNKCIDLDGAQTVNGANIQLFVVNGSPAQRWIISKKSTMDELAEEHKDDIEDGIYLIKSIVDSGYVMDVYNSSQSNEANVQIHSESGVSSQKWIISHDSKGYVTITNAGSNKVLDVFGGRTQNGTNIQQFMLNGSRAQKWIIKKQTDGSYEIVTALDRNKCIDLDGSKTVNGANIQLFVANGSQAQRWILLKK